MNKENVKIRVINHLIKWGNNEDDVDNMVDELFEEAYNIYKTPVFIAEYIRTNY